MLLLFFSLAAVCFATRSSPRRRPDYRFRTPPNADVIQVPSADTGKVTVIQVNLTGASELTWDFDGVVALLDTGGMLRVTDTILGSVEVADWFGTLNSPTAVVLSSDDLPAGQSRIVATYADAIDPNTQGWFLYVAAAQDPSFVGRLPAGSPDGLGGCQMGRIAVP